MGEDELPCKVDLDILNNPLREESDPIDYGINAVAHLLNVLHGDAALRNSELHKQLLSLVAYLDADPEQRKKSAAKDAAMDTMWFAPVGKALWFLRGREDPQLRRELSRLAKDPGVLVGNQYLFYIAGTLASKGYDVEFVPEQGKSGAKTPDLKAVRNGKTIWIEANAKQPTREIDSQEKLWQLIRDVIAEKKQKFNDPRYAPGMIVADISPGYKLLDNSGKPRNLKLRGELCRPLSGGDGFLYPLYEDADWQSRPENQDNVFAFIAEEFAAIDRAKFHVYQCLITITRQVWESDGKLAFPKGHQLLVHRAAENDAILDLSRHVYVVDSLPPR